MDNWPANAASFSSVITQSEFMTECVIEGLRSGSIPTQEEAEYLNQATVMSKLRPKITEEDLAWILLRCEESQDSRFGLYSNLLAPLAMHSEVRAKIRELWKNASNPYVRTQLFWRLIDDSDLPMEWHERLLEFILIEWEEFQDASRKYLGGRPETVFALAFERYTDPNWPASKKWGYLCSAAGAKGYLGPHRLLLEHAINEGSEFDRLVASKLLELLHGG